MLAKKKRPEEEFELELELEGERPNLIPYGAFLAGALGYLPVAALFGSCTLSAGGKFLAGWKLDPLIYFVFFTAVLHLPIRQFAKFPKSKLRVLILTLLFAAPLASYGYYRGGIPDKMALLELVLAVLPVALAAAVCLERTGNTLYTTLVLSLGTYVPLFLINDILGDLPTYFKIASNGMSYYVIRTLGPVLGLAAMFVSLKFVKRVH